MSLKTIGAFVAKVHLINTILNDKKNLQTFGSVCKTALQEISIRVGSEFAITPTSHHSIKSSLHQIISTSNHQHIKPSNNNKP